MGRPTTIAEIYALLEPDTGDIRYIGKANDSLKRFKRHMRDRVRRDYPLYRWINKLVREGREPDMIVLEVTEDWRSAERRLIEVSRARGCRLLNVAEGGDDPYCSPEQRSENGKRLVASLRSDPLLAYVRQVKQRFAQALKKDEVSNAARAKLRSAAAKRPDLFGLWANLPDRNEDASSA